MIPILYDAKENDFSHDGLGSLNDAISCTVTEERNGGFEAEMIYPSIGQHYELLKNDRILKIKPNDSMENQLFRIYKITRPMNGLVTVKAEHISYSLSGNPVAGFDSSGQAETVLNELLSQAIFENSFQIHTDIETSNSVSIKEPCSVRACLGGKAGSVLDVFGGEYEFDNFDITLWKQRGKDNGVTIEYGKNLMDLTQEEYINSTYTAILPYVKRAQGGNESYSYLPERVIYAPNAERFANQKATQIDFSSNFDAGEEVDVNRLRELAENYVKNNDIGVPKVSISVSFVDLSETQEYKDIAPLEKVHLCDLVTVNFSELGVSAKAKVVKTVYNALLERYESISIGDARPSFINSYPAYQEQAREDLAAASNEALTATQMIAGQKGGYIVYKLDELGKPTELLIMDTDSTSTATNVWRWNLAGLGFSDSGYDGPFDKIAITQDGKINADLITTGHLIADRISGGTLRSLTGSLTLNLDSGFLEAGNDQSGYRIQIGGRSISQIDQNGVRRTQIGPTGGTIFLRGETSSDPYVLITNSFAEFPRVSIDGKACSWTYDSNLGKYILTGEQE